MRKSVAAVATAAFLALGGCASSGVPEGKCYNHSLATCQGELANEDVTVTIVDDQGKVLVDKQGKTYANGFVGVWLPRDARGTVTVTHDGVRGSAPFATTEGSPSCMTTLRLTEKA